MTRDLSKSNPIIVIARLTSQLSSEVWGWEGPIPTTLSDRTRYSWMSISQIL